MDNLETIILSFLSNIMFTLRNNTKSNVKANLLFVLKEIFECGSYSWIIYTEQMKTNKRVN